ncbi:Hypothetical predicted protein [Octopus vulgaris]|uniref:Uncharacterized protein n=1 Tax=Octopus vulgaris TaxID=6645 RepID=A0AA36B0P7_OCTVU|nr:Hypothetical predicted protein [Octopus vulgaris]
MFLLRIDFAFSFVLLLGDKIHWRTLSRHENKKKIYLQLLANLYENTTSFQDYYEKPKGLLNLQSNLGLKLRPDVVIKGIFLPGKTVNAQA